MESDGLLLLFMSLHKRYRNKIFYERVVTDDDTKLKKYMTYPAYAPAGWVNHGGCLPSYLIEPSWFADPTHRAKCVADAFFEMIKVGLKETRTSKLDVEQMK